MIGLFRACGSSILSGTRLVTTTSPSCKNLFPLWGASFQHSSVRTVKFELLLTRLQFQSYSSKKSGEGSSIKGKLKSKPLMKDDKEAFFVVRKGDLVGVYKSLSDCQAQVGTSICDPPVSAYKGYNMPKDTEKHLMSCGLKNALYSIRASDLTEELFGTLISLPSSSRGETSTELVTTKKRPQEPMWSEYGEAVGPVLTANDALTKHFKLDPYRVDQNQSVCRSCTIEFDGASKGNPGQAGAGAILRSDDGNLICRLREGLGIATNNFAEYRGFILGLRYALGKGFTSVRVRGDSKLVCMQIQGLWKVKNQNISGLFDEAKKLKDRFLSFQIIHVLRDLNSEADTLANLAVDLAEGQIQEEVDK
ncbi:uncharacterized protein LOC130993685 isoform X2 [Salvia miltiorrhiza]|uniref:uncharacterized protein LOC130993685 isoform X2 n=1 Tax=Salvia miltiorrhiza TaxID=226208 RepID=UPI0025ACDC3E|nr:uncharacterized protein LOC130993685 isoform X2 [Salvia miltiorrhiza]XP_057774683.1 uncharacterized protein LOC130993685 isoform X2 [Salvia miltiorrhiza]XP_057774684.1 uncharacterized protein LOC130993685 isoform X2 [Salvia miltiorrhiza]XP_057774685.1 uncharacterized protein LOC130993685 isoform X2 [Salvia miltiorrhiza]XP_057774686.1 uncharacterized protein LOC130993685 isoform X2 [Salvia miltiorrhiza]XP_057774687.1 uncharacterized protein LOC130993685 isoform X2 [Salvia miltiorrhiza]XP_05